MDPTNLPPRRGGEIMKKERYSTPWTSTDYSSYRKMYNTSDYLPSVLYSKILRLKSKVIDQVHLLSPRTTIGLIRSLQFAMR